MTPLDTWPRTHYELLQHYHAQYDEGIRTGQFRPFVYPWGTLGIIPVIIYLLIPHRKGSWLSKCRFVAWLWIVAIATHLIKDTRAKNMAPTFGLGLISAWVVIWTLAILVCNDAQTDFQRIERMEGAFKKNVKEKDQSNGNAETNQEVRNDSSAFNSATVHHEHLGPGSRHGEFAWQPFPLEPFVERLDWVLDIFCNFRGMGWNWRISSIPPAPKWVQTQLARNSPNPPQHSNKTHPGQSHVYPTRRALLLANLKTALQGYLTLDLLKTLTNHDPYFWGLVDRAPPPYFPFSLLHNHPILLKLFHLTVSQYIIKSSLETLFSLAPLFFSGLLGPSLLGARAEPWMYPETWGSYYTVFDRGLAGWWASWWHQTFRFAFEEPSRKIIEVLNMNRRSAGAKALQLVLAFGLSGFLHACGSYTQWGPSRPLRGPMAYFLSQAVGIFLEGYVTGILHRVGIQRRVERNVPKWARRGFTFAYVHFWFYHTSPLLCDDFARGGIWLYEPIPVSLFRGLGLGVEGDGWWCWGGEWGKWHSAEKWWKSGFAL
ncbi:membrane bound O-acyl transferase family-domain-containing protein [Clohesyomyces aquaticus]|uniref:Membrane bound O-acyl transferase family-domain-containing protein n=1 Tax=Clohesyomyces aquaticus TaxID=1231657 RepID=A0A1Y2A5A0_9PLEO|nr:membrane bound O-acyl transferase family-domain-containing protein [Clohesyomyces aquaticus]